MRVYGVGSGNFNIYNSKISHGNNPKQVSFGANPTQPINIYKRLLGKFTDLFNYNNGNNLPQTLNAVKRADNGNILGFNIHLKNDNTLTVNKFFPDGNATKTPYLVLKENGNGAFRDFITLDLQYGRILYHNKFSALPIFEHGRFKEIPLTDEKHAIYESQLESWFKEIFPEDASNLEKQKDAMRNNQTGKKRGRPPKNPQQSPIVTVPADIYQKPVVPPLSVPEPKPVTVSVPVSGEKIAALEPESTDGLSVLLGKNQPTAEEIVQKTKEIISAKQLEEKIPTKTVENPTRLKRGLKENYGILDEALQNDIRAINESMRKFSKFRDDYASHSVEITSFKNNYAPIVNSKNTQAIIFKYGENETLRVINTARQPRFTRFIHTDKDGKETHLLIVDGDKVAANLKTDAMKMPLDFRYYSAEDLKTMPHIAQWTKFIKEGLEKYYSDLTNSFKDIKPIKHRTQKVNSPIIKSSEISEESTPKIKQTTEQILPEMQKSGVTDEMLDTIAQTAKSDAQKLAQHYVNELIKNFKQQVNEQMQNMQKIFTEIFIKN